MPRRPPPRAARSRQRSRAPPSTSRLVAARSGRGRPGPAPPRRTARSGRLPAWSFPAGPAVRLRSRVVPSAARDLFSHEQRSLASLGMTRRGLPAMCPAMSFLDHIARCNNADLSEFEPWFVGDARAGFIHRDFLPIVAVRPDLFSHRDGAWYLEPSLDTPDKRTTAMRDFLLTLHAKGMFGRLWRDEPYKVARHFNEPTLLEMERAAVPWFGVRAY